MDKVFKKPSLSVNEQIDLYQRRGLIIRDRARVAHYLNYISYYRLSGYAKFFCIHADNAHKFLNGTTFEDILDLYFFDKQLRSIILEAMEVLEIAIRSVINNKMCVIYSDPHWYMNKDHFFETQKFTHAAFIQKIRAFMQSSNACNEAEQQSITKSYYRKYKYPNLPPCWMVAETLSFGIWSLAYAHLRRKSDRKAISQQFSGLEPKVFQSWLHSPTFLRNLCAHHARIWNNRFTITPKIIRHNDVKRQFVQTGSLYAYLAVIHHLLQGIAPHDDWRYKLYALCQKYPKINVAEMGFPYQWDQDLFWAFAKQTTRQVKSRNLMLNEIPA